MRMKSTMSLLGVAGVLIVGLYIHAGKADVSSTSPLVACAGDLVGTFPQCDVRKDAIAGARGVNMNTTADQVLLVNNGLPLPFPYFVTSIVLANCNSTVGALTAGGVYTGTNKSGNAVVPASTGYGALAGVNRILNMVLSGSSSPLSLPTSTTQVYFSLSIASGSTGLCDVFLYGNELALPGGN
jgi:hypothetical protein